MRAFKHVPNFSFPELTATMTESGRFYHTPDGNAYPSVTTILSKGSDSTWLEEWKKRVGEAEVKKVSAQAAARGTRVHEIIELYLRNDPEFLKNRDPFDKLSFKDIQGFLDENIGLIAGLEVPLYSDFLRTAGRVDCIAKWQGIWSIVDFKTSRKEKQKEDIKNYYMQEAAYSYMVYERIGLVVPQLVTVMTVDDGDSLVFIEKAKDHLKDFIALRNSVTL